MSSRMTQSSAGQKRMAASHDLMTNLANCASSGEGADSDHGIGSAGEVTRAAAATQIRPARETRRLGGAPSGQQSRRAPLVEQQDGVS